MKQYAVKDILPNPFRHMSRYPIRKDKVAALRESLRTTGFWDNVVARPKNGKAEIAYGHHRLVALKDEFGPSHKVTLILRNLSDEVMLQMMARENMEEWGTSAAVEHETIRAVVEAYAKGQVKLPEPDSDTPRTAIRYAPSFIAGEDVPRARAQRPYTVQTLSDFIGWLQPNGEPQDKVYAALSALQFIEEGLLKERHFDGLTTKQAEAVIEEARKARSRREDAARVQRMLKEQAEREAKEAERRREQAELERRRKEAEAAKARDAEARRRAEMEARRSAEQRREAEQVIRQAEKRREAAHKREEQERETGRRQATAVGRAVSEQLKSGKIGYRQAANVALKVVGKQAAPPPDIEDFARRLATDVNNIFDAERDPKTARLKLLVQYREHLDAVTRADLARTLTRVANRLLDYARQLDGAVIAVNQRLLRE